MLPDKIPALNPDKFFNDNAPKSGEQVMAEFMKEITKMFEPKEEPNG